MAAPTLVAEMTLAEAATLESTLLATGPETLPVELPALYPAQQQIKADARRFNVLDIGRRAGKTFLGVHLSLETALAGQPCGWFVPSYKYVLEVWRDLQRPLFPIKDKCRINATERRIELPNGGLVEVWTLENGDAGRGRKYQRVIVDEAAMVPKLKSSWEEAIRPTLTDLQGDAWFLSTPKGLNYFHDLFQRGQDDKAFADWRSWQLPSSVNPYLPPTEIEAQREELPEQVYKQEYLAEFISGDGAVFRNVDACLTAQLTTPEDHAGHTLVAGVDWARKHDFTAISVLCCHCRAEVHLDRFNQIGWDFQRQRLLSIIDQWGVREVQIELNSIGSPNFEAMYQAAPRSVLLQGFETTAKSKPKLIQALALCFERAFLQWLPDPIARHELVAYEATITENGHTKYGAPEGGWDDTVIARALARRAARTRIPIPLTDDEKLEAALPTGWQIQNAPAMGGWERDGWEMARDWRKSEIKEELKRKNPDLDDYFAPQSPLVNTADDPWGSE